MTTMKRIPTVSHRIHPLLAGAAASLTLLCGAGVLALAGWLPGSQAEATDIADSAPLAASQIASAPEAPITPVAAPVAASAPTTAAQKPRMHRAGRGQETPSAEYQSKVEAPQPAPQV